MATNKMPRSAVKASFWQFDPETEEEWSSEVVAMESGAIVERSDDDRVMLSVRGRPRGRYETGDSVWLEFEDREALRLIEAFSRALQVEWSV